MPSTVPVAPARRWWVLTVLALAQLMVVLDVTVVNIALPSAQADLGFSPGDRQWVVTAYTLAFGGLLLLAGRLSDLLGTTRIFLIGLVGFALASALGGAAPTFALMVAARALQGVFAALLAPAALSLLSTTFSAPHERARAFGAFGAIGVGGGAVGLLLGGVLTEYTSWRWCFYLNVPISVLAVVGGLALLPRQARGSAHLDLPGTITACLGLVGVVSGFSQAEAHGWGGASTLGLVAAGVVLLVVFVAIQRRAAHPLLPLRIVADRGRAGALIALAANSAALLAVFLFLAYYLQQNLGWTPVQGGLGFLPSPVVTALASVVLAPRLARRFGDRAVIAGGQVVAVIGMVVLAQIDGRSSYWLVVLPGLVGIALGLGAVSGLAMARATHGVLPQDAGVAGAAVNTMQQVGGALGTALLSTIAVQVTDARLSEAGASATTAAAAGYSAAFWASAAVLLVGLVASVLLLRDRADRAGAERAGANPVGATPAGR